MRQKQFWVLGGDQRQAALASALAQDGYQVTALALDRAELSGEVDRAAGLEGIGKADCVVLPLPVRGEGGRLNAPLCGEGYALEDVLAALHPEQFICGGRVDAETRDLAARQGLSVHDYFTREELAVANAVPGALAVWLRNITLYTTSHRVIWVV